VVWIQLFKDKIQRGSLVYTVMKLRIKKKGDNLTSRCVTIVFSRILSIYVSIYLFMDLQPFVEPWPLLQFLNLFTQSVGILGQGIRPSQGRYLNTEQHKQNKRT
jgi:hypothetical protein